MRRLMLALALCTATSALAQRTYWRATVAQIASGTDQHTHVRLENVRVVYATVESDSDFHMRLRDPKDAAPSHFVVAECIPAVPCRHPRVGETVSVRGILRRDMKHEWWEIHPVERLSP